MNIYTHAIIPFLTCGYFEGKQCKYSAFKHSLEYL